MSLSSIVKPRVALVFGTVPNFLELDQFKLIKDIYDVHVIACESVMSQIQPTVIDNDFTLVILPNHVTNDSYMPGLENMLGGYNVVIVKERLGLYAYQVLKAKWQFKFKLLLWVDNLVPFPCEQMQEIKTICGEISHFCDQFIVHSQAAKAVLELEGNSPDKIQILAPWVASTQKRNPKSRARALESLGMCESNILISYVGSLEWDQGILELFSGVKFAIKNTPTLFDKVKIVLCGSGTYVAEIKKRAIDLGLDSCLIHLSQSLENYSVILAGTDFLYASSFPTANRYDGNVFQYSAAMANGIPVLSARGPIVEETVGKHRIDFCIGSPVSFSRAFLKAVQEKHLLKDANEKNIQKFNELYQIDKVKKQIQEIFINKSEKNCQFADKSHATLLNDAEQKVLNKQYLAAIDLIEYMLSDSSLPYYQKGNLYRLIGDCFTKLGDTVLGKKAYIQAIDVDAYGFKSYIGLGTIALMKGQFEVAVVQFQKAIGLAPHDEMANLGMGLAFQGLEELIEANKWVKRALEFNRSNTAAIYTIVKIAYDLEAFKDAETAVRAYLEVHPHDQSMLYTLGGILFKLNEYSEVLHLMENILATNPMDAQAQNLIKQTRKALTKNQQSIAS